MKIKNILLGVSILSASCSVFAQTFIENLSDNIQSNWDKSLSGNTDFYLPLHTWHNRHFYTSEKIASFNENPWGLGFGKSYLDEKQNWHGFYTMAFLDSHSKIEPIAGYGYTKNWYKDDFYVGVGYTAFLTARSDINHYLPVPGVLPLFSTGYKNFSLTGTYLPGKTGSGNIAFIWGRYTFN